MDHPVEGARHTFERTFTERDVRQFAAISGDAQSRHIEPTGDGDLLVHGLLTATLPTKIGGDLNVLATEMTFEFVRPVYTGEPITCAWTTETVTELDDRYELTVDVNCENSAEETVLTGAIEGLVWKESDGAV